MPEWKHDIGRQLDDLIVRLVPGVNKAVRWNTPFYGVADNGWFLSFHCFTKYIKLTFHNGGSLNPPPPVESKYDYIRYFHIFENDDVETDQLTSWITQSAALPGEAVF